MVHHGKVAPRRHLGRVLLHGLEVEEGNVDQVAAVHDGHQLPLHVFALAEAQHLSHLGVLEGTLALASGCREGPPTPPWGGTAKVTPGLTMWTHLWMFGVFSRAGVPDGVHVQDLHLLEDKRSRWRMTTPTPLLLPPSPLTKLSQLKF